MDVGDFVKIIESIIQDGYITLDEIDELFDETS